MLLEKRCKPILINQYLPSVEFSTANWTSTVQIGNLGGFNDYQILQ